MSLAVAINKTETRQDNGGSQYTAYVVECTANNDGRTWSCEKRYSEFEALQRQLDESGAALPVDLSGVSTFPAKSFFGTLRSDVVSERRAALSSWLNGVLQAFGSDALSAMTEFLGAPPPAGSAGFDLGAVTNPATFDSVCGPGLFPGASSGLFPGAFSPVPAR